MLLDQSRLATQLEWSLNLYYLMSFGRNENVWMSEWNKNIIFWDDVLSLNNNEISLTNVFITHAVTIKLFVNSNYRGYFMCASTF